MIYGGLTSTLSTQPLRNRSWVPYINIGGAGASASAWPPVAGITLQSLGGVGTPGAAFPAGAFTLSLANRILGSRTTTGGAELTLGEHFVPTEITGGESLALTRAGAFLRVNAAANATLTVPTNASVAFPIGSVILVCRIGAGPVFVAAATPATTTIRNQTLAENTPQYGVFSLRKIATDEWIVESQKTPFSTTSSGVVPAYPGSTPTTDFLRADGTWAAPAASGVSDGDKGDISVSLSGTAWAIDAKVVTFAKIQDIPELTLVGNPTATAGTAQTITLGAGLTFTGSTLAISTVPIANGGTGATDKQTAVTNLVTPLARAGTTSNFTLQASDSGAIIEIEATSAINITVPSGLPAGFNCVIVQGSTGQATLVASGVTLKSYNNLLKTAGQNAAISIFPGRSSGTYIVTGATA